MNPFRASLSLQASLFAAALLVAPVACKRQQQAAAPAPHADPAPIAKAAPPTPLDVKSAELGGPTWDPAWNVVVERALPPALLTSGLPHDVRRFCPRYPTLVDADRRAFWAYFFEAVASAEAGLNPRANVHHTEPEVNVVDTETGLRSRQAGLLQLKYQDAERYGCNFNWEADKHLPIKDPNRSILRPENNLECGVKILSNQVLDMGRPLVTPASYWAVLHPGTAGNRNFLRQITNPPAACGLHGGRSPHKSAVAERETARLVQGTPAVPVAAAPATVPGASPAAAPDAPAAAALPQR